MPRLYDQGGHPTDYLLGLLHPTEPERPTWKDIVALWQTYLEGCVEYAGAVPSVTEFGAWLAGDQANLPHLKVYQNHAPAEVTW
jgi:hypothetical protein